MIINYSGWKWTEKKKKEDSMKLDISHIQLDQARAKISWKYARITVQATARNGI